MEAEFDPLTLYLITDLRTGGTMVLPGGEATKYRTRDQVKIRIATRQEAEIGWQFPLHPNWRVAP